MIYLVLLVVAVAAAECIVRKRYFSVHGVPYRCKHIAEYPYNEFIEQCPPPLCWKLKPGYSGRQVHINSVGLRSPELHGDRARIWLVGESEFFGAKLSNEKKIWYRQLQKMLNQGGYHYQVVNASIIGYNQVQAKELTLSLPLAPGDILLLRSNLNDVSIAYMQGEKWQPGTTWPIEFIHKLQSHKAWYLKLLDRSCLGMLLRRNLLKKEGRKNVFSPASGFQWQTLLAYLETHCSAMVEYGVKCGARVGFFNTSFSYSPEISEKEAAGLAAIQHNWREFVEGWSKYQFGAVDEVYRRVGRPAKLPLLDLAAHIWNHPERYLLYLDLVHFNEQGHRAVAEALFKELQTSGILEKSNV